MAKALLITLGTGQGVENGIAKSIDNHNPNKLFFIATSTSLGTIPRIEAAIGRPLEHEPPLLVDNAEDMEACWKTTAQAINQALQAGFKLEEITLDFTSGTKAMSSGAVLAGVSLECGYLSYVGGARRDAQGRVITGTERVITLTPNQVFLENRRRLIQNFFNAFQYEACLALIQQAAKGSADPAIQAELRSLENLVMAYSFWDKFDHAQAASCFRQVPRTWDSRWRIDTSHSKEMVFQIAGQREAYASSQKIEDKYSLHILSDLMANAERRAQEGKYDDAVARLYRAVEVIAQMLLGQKGIDTSAVRLDQLPPEWQTAYKGEVEPLKLGQEKAFALLESLGHPAGKQYRENKNLRNYLTKRNSSILAHELEPVSKNVYEELNRETLNLAIKAFPRLSDFKEKCRFPGLELS